MTHIADEVKELPADADLGVVRHPSGWWKANERWNPPADVDGTDRMVALSVALATVIVGSLVTAGAIGNLALLLSGTAGALVTRWWIDGGVEQRLMAAAGAMCASAGATLLVGIVQLDAATTSAHRAIFMAATAAVMATALTMVELKHHHTVSI